MKSDGVYIYSFVAESINPLMLECSSDLLFHCENNKLTWLQMDKVKRFCVERTKDNGDLFDSIDDFLANPPKGFDITFDYTYKIIERKSNHNIGEYYKNIYRPVISYKLQNLHQIMDEKPLSDCDDDISIWGEYKNEYSSHIRQLELILDELKSVFKVVEPTQENLQTYGNTIRNIIILSCTEIDSVMKKILNPSYYLSNRVKFTITNFKKKTGEIINDDDEKDLDTAVVYDDPAPQTVDFTDEGIRVNAPANTDVDTLNSDKKPKENAPANDPGIEITVGEGDEKAGGKTVAGKVDLNTPINPKEPWTRYKYPTLDLLKKYDDGGKVFVDEDEQLANKKRIVDVLASFGVQIKSIRATVGPTITLYEITPAEGVRISKINCSPEQ